MSVYDPPICEQCVNEWVRLSRPADKYLILSRGGHIPGCSYWVDPSSPAGDNGESVRQPSTGDSHSRERDQLEGIRVVEAEEIYPPERTIERRTEMYIAALTGNWRLAQEIRRSATEPGGVDAFNEPITQRGETALHIATMFEQTEFAKKLVARMSIEGLRVKAQNGHTALYLAVIDRNMEIVRAILMCSPEMVWERDRNHLLPIHWAAFWGRNKEMVRFLYALTREYLREDDIPDLLVALIEADMFDVVLDMARRRQFGERMATRRSSHMGVETAFQVMARKPHMFSKVNCWRKLFDSRARDAQKLEARQLLRRVWQTIIPTLGNLAGLALENDIAIFMAVEKGNLEFLRILIRSYPELVTETNLNGWTIFHAAIFHRQEKIFALIHEIGSLRKAVVECIDGEGNNMLHLAAQLAPQSLLEIRAGAALQLHLELLWFQEVKDVVGPQFANTKTINTDKPKTADELFTETHKDLAKRGEEWIRNTANSCIIVAVLVATVAFTAAFTLPGGNAQDTGFPMFLNKVPFKVFAVADAISFICSACSVLAFLAILTSTYSLHDFVWSLPLKLLIGLSTLFVSIIALMVAFVAAFFVYYQPRRALKLHYALPITTLAFVPVCLFLFLHFRFFTGVIKSIRDSHFTPDRSDPLFPAVKGSRHKWSTFFSRFKRRS